MANDPDEALTKAWLANWERAGSRLASIRQRELREFRHEDNQHIIIALLELGVTFGQPRATSGLIEQQRLLRKADR